MQLAAAGDFVAELQRVDGVSWAAGEYAELVFPITTPVTWTAVATGSVLRFDKTETQVAAYLSARAGDDRAQLWYVNGTTRVLWAEGVARANA